MKPLSMDQATGIERRRYHTSCRDFSAPAFSLRNGVISCIIKSINLDDRNTLCSGRLIKMEERMTYRKIIGSALKYLPFLGLLALNIYSLYQGMTTIADETSRNIRIWTNALQISAIVGEIGSLLVIDRFNLLLSGKTPNFVQDILEDSGQDISVTYNGMIVSSLFVPAIFILYIVYIATGIHLFSNVAITLAVLWAISTVVYFLAGYLKVKHTFRESIFSKLSNPVFVPTIVCMIQIMITQENRVGYIYHNICNPENDFFLSLALVIVLCYFLAVSFCHFSNIYCLIGFWFIKRDAIKIQRKIDLLQKKEENQEILLRHVTQDIDDVSKQTRAIKKIGLVFRFFLIHIKTYAYGRLHAVSYLLSLFNLKITKLFNHLLEPDRIRINGIRFCLITAVLELLSLDFILFIYLESDSPTLKFFELVSTVIIIPILLSWLTELKFKAKEDADHITTKKTN